MARYYRYRLPPWLRYWLLVIERCLLPIVIFQGLRTIFFPTTFDVLLLGIFIGLYLAFFLEWI
ncbi:hypothetical protein NC661_02120 [Aquibacillus koreensis]|uniref:Membrane protein YszA n=1 Tax=Aquibacillus koreensis TaxID=279446 RepID=A0A9X3WKS0_9BACI|nr:hypothetical protein [Aquibacillus koreensis]MCT2537935.1 hypothetical protein [Aquibacillus koreensis]MDC3419174.1 hypothetical protein [Aquibacillus koreensis]